MFFPSFCRFVSAELHLTLRAHVLLSMFLCRKSERLSHFLVCGLQKWGQTLSTLSVSQILIPDYYLCPSPALRRNHLAHMLSVDLSSQIHTVWHLLHTITLKKKQSVYVGRGAFLWNNKGEYWSKGLDKTSVKMWAMAGTEVRGEVIRYNFLSHRRQYTLITLSLLLGSFPLFEKVIISGRQVTFSLFQFRGFAVAIDILVQRNVFHSNQGCFLIEQLSKINQARYSFICFRIIFAFHLVSQLITELMQIW